jgi:hypothetical protein
LFGWNTTKITNRVFVDYMMVVISFFLFQISGIRNVEVFCCRVRLTVVVVVVVVFLILFVFGQF